MLGSGKIHGILKPKQFITKFVEFVRLRKKKKMLVWWTKSVRNKRP